MPYNVKLVRGLREQRGWNQTVLAYRAGVGVTVISDFENSKRQTPKTAAKIARALKVKIGELWIPEEAAAEAGNGNGSRRKEPAGARR